MRTITRAVKTKSKPAKPAVRATATAGPSSGYLSTIAAAKLCGVSVFSVQRWFDEGILAGARLPGGRRRIDAKSLDAFIKKHVLLPGGNPNTAQRRVLIVEDDARLLEVLRDGLAAQGYLVRTATGGLAAGLAMHEFHPDCVVLDVMLKDLPGPSVVRQLRQSQAGRATRIVAISGKAAPEDVHEVITAGANTFLKKPFTIPELIKAISSRRQARV